MSKNYFQLEFCGNFESIRKIAKERNCSDYSNVNMVYEKNFHMLGIHWTLKIYPFGNNTPHLSVYIGIDDMYKINHNFSCEIDLEMILVNQKSEQKSIKFSVSGIIGFEFDNNTCYYKDIGRREFICLDEITNRNIGWLDEKTGELKLKINLTLCDVKFTNFVQPLRKTLIEFVSSNGIDINKVPYLLLKPKCNYLKIKQN